MNSFLMVVFVWVDWVSVLAGYMTKLQRLLGGGGGGGGGGGEENVFMLLGKKRREKRHI